MNKPLRPKGEDLLDRIQEKAGCPYLSDLHTSAFLEEVKAAVFSIPNEEFSLWEWSEAVSYITGQPCLAKTVQEAKLFLWHWQDN